MRKRCRGFATILAVLGIAIAGSFGIYGLSLNAGVISSMKRVSMKNSITLVKPSLEAESMAMQTVRRKGRQVFEYSDPYRDGWYLYNRFRTEERDMWIRFIDANQCAVRELAGHKAFIKKMARDTKQMADYWSAAASEKAAVANVRYYRGYMERTDTEGGITWIFPVFKEIPDGVRKGAIALNGDGLKAFVIAGSKHENEFPAGLAAASGKVDAYYLARSRGIFDAKHSIFGPSR